MSNELGRSDFTTTINLKEKEQQVKKRQIKSTFVLIESIVTLRKKSVKTLTHQRS